MSLNEAAAHCPECGTEYRAGFDTCADDGTRLVPGPMPEPVPDPQEVKEPPRPDAHFVELTTLLANEARLLVGRLRSEGIEAWVDPPDISAWPGYGYGGTRERPVKVLVPEDRLEAAARIAREVMGA